jgi:hypothetical protein
MGMEVSAASLLSGSELTMHLIAPFEAFGSIFEFRITILIWEVGSNGVKLGVFDLAEHALVPPGGSPVFWSLIVVVVVIVIPVLVSVVIVLPVLVPLS